MAYLQLATCSCNNPKFPECILIAKMREKFNSCFALGLHANQNKELEGDFYYPRCPREEKNNITKNIDPNLFVDAQEFLKDYGLLYDFINKQDRKLINEKLSSCGFSIFDEYVKLVNKATETKENTDQYSLLTSNEGEANKRKEEEKAGSLNTPGSDLNQGVKTSGSYQRDAPSNIPDISEANQAKTANLYFQKATHTNYPATSTEGTKS